MNQSTKYIIALFLGCFFTINLNAQFTLTGLVKEELTGKIIQEVEIHILTTGDFTTTDEEGYFEFNDLSEGTYEIAIFSFQYEELRQFIEIRKDTELQFELEVLKEELTEVVVNARKAEEFARRRLKDVEGTAIYKGKKTEVVILGLTLGNLATNNSRQIFSQIVGLNIYEGNDGGLQLGIGGRGLDPNRTANFNTRQNGYDISADVLGYPESYYTPPAEALSEIQVVRGAASLQYGTQFGGLINFKMYEAPSFKKLELISRQSVGSFGLFNSFNAIGGTIKKFKYYTYYNFKKGDGYRPNSAFDSRNFYAFAEYAFTKKTKLSFEATYFKYLSQQAGGLTDAQFNENPRQSTRDRNWFEVDWKLYNAKFNHEFSDNTTLNISVFALDAERNSVGYRGNPANLNENPVTSLDEQDNAGNYILPRDLIKGTFQNYGAEARFLTKYSIAGKEAVLLVGAKYYDADNTSKQGAGSNGINADFNFYEDVFPDYANQSNFKFPNQNIALFGEHIFYLSEKLSITPGLRFEYINTQSSGSYQRVLFDNAGNLIFKETLSDDRMLPRKLLLLGTGLSYRPNAEIELYANFSQNYRSVTFSDIRVVNPTFIIDPDISDEKGFTTDIGLRGRWKKKISYDLGVFGLIYNDRIGIILDDRANRVRKNIGKAAIVGLETFVDFNIARMINEDNRQFKFNYFINGALTKSEYIDSEENNVKGKQVEFIPFINLKTGLTLGYKNFLASTQFTYLSSQFTDVQNSSIPSEGDIRSGVIGEIPAYHVMDLSLSYTWKKLKLEKKKFLFNVGD